MKNLKRALAIRTGTLSDEEMLKAKYLRREGGPGHYKYFYKEAKGKKPGKGESEEKTRISVHGQVKKMTIPKELSKYITQENKLLVGKALKAGWRPKSLNEYTNESAEEEADTIRETNSEDLERGYGITYSDIQDLSNNRIINIIYGSKNQFIKDNPDMVSNMIEMDAEEYLDKKGKK